MNQPLAFVHHDAKIAPNVVIEPFAYITKDVEIGEGTWIGPHAVIMDGARIGKNCRVFPGAVVSAIPQDLKYKGEETLTIIGDNTTIRECVTINRGTVALGKTQVGDNCLIMAYVHIAHDCVVGNNCILVNNVTLAGHIVIDDWAILGGLTAVQQFLHIGAHVMIAGGSKVMKNVPPFVKAARDPLSYAGINSVGLRRRNFSNEAIRAIQDSYRLVFQSGHNVSHALELVESEIAPLPERDEILKFIRSAKGGIIKGYTGKKDDEE